MPRRRRRWLASRPRPWADEDFPDWETLEYVALKVGEHRNDVEGDIRDVLSEERGVRVRSDPDPADIEWRHLKGAETSRRYPRLWALFGAHWVEY
ncbi:hypothetical protein ACFQX7_39715 [Luedemannella flava]